MVLESILIFIVTLILIRFFIYCAPKIGFMDIPNVRSMHKCIEPRGAGICIYLAVVMVDPWFNFALILEHYPIFLATFLVFIIGVLDDYHGISPKTKLIVISLSALLAYFDGIYISSLGNLFGTEISLGWFDLPFTIFAIVGLTNALNLIDGLDGLAGSIGIVILSALFSIGYIHDDTIIMMASSVFIAGLLAFMFYNWNPASVFLGDSGSLVLGFIIGLLLTKSATYIHPVTVLFIVAVPLMDTIIVMVRRKVQGKSMFEADKTHLHHVFFYFFDQDIKTTVIFLSVLQAIYSIIALFVVENTNQTMSLILFCFNVVLWYFVSSEMLRGQIADANSREDR